MPYVARTLLPIVISMFLGLAVSRANAQAMQGMQAMHHDHGGAKTAAAALKPPVFIASTAKPFSALMDDAMAVMDDGMKRAPMNGHSEHDFIVMMLPHHQGAIDMAR